MMAFAQRRGRRYFAQTHNPIDGHKHNPIDTYTDYHFLSRYRLPRETVRRLAAGYGASNFCSTTGRGFGISVEERFCVALRFLATGCKYNVVAEYQGVTRSTLCRCLSEVVDYLGSLAYENFAFPKNRHEQRVKAQEFYKKTGKPRVIGVIDGTHVPIMRPRGQGEYPFVNHKRHFYSLNAMMVVDASLRFIHADVRFPGSVEDAYILLMSRLSDFCDDGRMLGYCLLGDSSYPLRQWLLTPYESPTTPQQMNYNRWHCSVWSTVKEAISQLKQRWRAIDDTAGYLMSAPVTCAKIIVACCILHNIAIDEHVPILIDNDADGREEHIPLRRDVYYWDLGGDIPYKPDLEGILNRDQFSKLFPSVVLPIGNNHVNAHRKEDETGALDSDSDIDSDSEVPQRPQLPQDEREE